MGILNKLFGKNKQESDDNRLENQTELTEKTKKYIETFNEDDVPGWDAIENALEKIYAKDSQRHYGTVIKYPLGEDLIDGFDIYDNNEQSFHRHIISYGMSELYYSPESANDEFSKWGFEFTMRLEPFEDDIQMELDAGKKVEHEPRWVIHLMQNLARYVFESEKWFEPYHFISTNSPIRLETDTKLVGIAFVPDVQLGAIETPHGKVDFLQMVGLTQKELDWLLEKPEKSRVKELIDKMREDNPMLIVDLKREKEYVD